MNLKNAPTDHPILTRYLNRFMLIAIAMKMEAGTIKTHLKSLFTKLGASTRTEVAQLARKRGLLH